MLTILFNQAYIAPRGWAGDETSAVHSRTTAIKRRRKEIRRAIEQAMKSLTSLDRRKVKRAVRNVQAKAATFDTVAVVGVLPVPMWELESIRAQIEIVSRGLSDRHSERLRAQELGVLFQKYLDEMKRIERDEEERAAAIVVSLLA